MQPNFVPVFVFIHMGFSVVLSSPVCLPADILV